MAPRKKTIPPPANSAAPMTARRLNANHRDEFETAERVFFCVERVMASNLEMRTWLDRLGTGAF